MATNRSLKQKAYKKGTLDGGQNRILSPQQFQKTEANAVSYNMQECRASPKNLRITNQILMKTKSLRTKYRR